jgi:DNA-directed RNA polymerase subunit omega
MIEPSISSLLEKAEDRYSLCIIAGKRARQLISGANKLTACSSKNAVTVAVNEINENKIAYKRTKWGIK